MPTDVLEVKERALARPGNRRADIQGLRAVAVLLVVAYHAGLPLPGGFIGVDVFFVISGFVIAAMLRREWRSTGRIRFGTFYWRRFKRLTPALAVSVAVTVAAAALVLPLAEAQRNAAATGLGAMLIVANVVIAGSTGGYFAPPAELNPLLHTWSLSVEEQFYLAFPALLAAGWHLSRRRTFRGAGPVLLVAGVFLLSLAGCLLGAAATSLGSSTEALLGFYSPVARAWEFAAGALLALAPDRLRVTVRQAWAMGLTGAALLIAAAAVIDSGTAFPGPWTVLPVAATVLLLAAGSAENGVSRLLARPSAVFLGDRSYSVYLWHWPFIVYAGFLAPDLPWAPMAAAALSLAPAAASYRWIEQSVRDARITTRRSALALAGATLAVPLAVVGTAYGLTADGSPGADLSAVDRSVAVAPGPTAATAEATSAATSPSATATPTEPLGVEAYDAARALHVANSAGCQDMSDSGPAALARCTWNAEARGPHVYLIGDSNADHFSDAAISAGQVLGRPVTITAASTCPMVDLTYEYRGPDAEFLDVDDARCRRYIDDTLAQLESAPPATVIISQANFYWYESDFAAGPGPEALTTDTGEKLGYLEQGLESTVRRLLRAGHGVVLVHTVPWWTGEYDWSLLRCSLQQIESGECRQTMPAAERFHGDRGAVRRVVEEVAGRTGAIVIDPWDEICERGVCSTESASFVRYRDPFHISVPQSKAFGPVFADALRLAG